VQDLKISLITVTRNAEKTIGRCIKSVIDQNFTNIEYIIIDGGSTDKTIPIITQYARDISYFISEPDDGIYDAMNKGIKLASGDIIGMLNADDFFSDDEVLAAVAGELGKNDVDIVYGDLDYINAKGNIVRKWRSKSYKDGLFNWGWMPPHPTFYCKRNLFGILGLYSLEYGTAADYELMLRYMHLNMVRSSYIKKVMVKMSVGGASNKNYRNRVKGLLYDLKAMRNNGIKAPVLALLFKPLRKIVQYFS
jgi:glycosyltransferase involved in cell wall biosynthesis